MKCIECGREVENLKKYQIHECICKAKLMCIEVKGKKQLIDLRNKEEK